MFTADGRHLVSGSNDTTVKVWDVAAATEIAVLRGHSDAVYSVALSPDGNTLASASRDKTVKLWNLKTFNNLGAYAQGEKGHVPRPARIVKIEARFTAKVTGLEMIGIREAKAVPIEIIPMWLADVEIVSIEKPVMPFDKKAKLTLAIHSPARLFLRPAEEVPGRQYSFTVRGKLKDGSREFYAAQATEKAGLGGSDP